MKNIIFYSLLFLFVAVTSCKEDDEDQCRDPTNPECANYDPCFGMVETTAFFTISQALSGFGDNASVFIEDDVVTGGTLKFSAIPQEGATYTWILGVDTIEGNFEITTELGSLPNGVYPNKLIVTKQTDTTCFPLDTGIDEYTRSFTKITGCEAAILGRYRGVFSSNPTDSTEIELALSPSPQGILPCNPNGGSGFVFIVNANLNGDSIRTDGDGFVNTQFHFKAFGAIDQPEGKAILNSENEVLSAEYSIGDVDYLFSGIKL
jgi:hypothetical protein